MKIFRFFLSKIFLRKIILTLSIIALLFMSSYVVFSATRSIVSATEGKGEVLGLNQQGNYVANLDPSSNIELDNVSAHSMQAIYDFLEANYSFAFYTDGFIANIPNQREMEIPLAYLNEEYYKLNKFKLSDGSDLTFDYDLKANKPIPVLVGKGLSEQYPIGSTIHLKEPTLERPVELIVKGVLAKDASHSNLYALSSKQYYNFSVLIPVNKEFIDEANLDLKINGLMDLIVVQTNKDEVSNLSNLIQKNAGFRMNFFSQQENIEYFNKYFDSSMKFVAIISLILFSIICAVALWNIMLGVRLIIKDLTINLLVGLSYSRLRRVFYAYYGALVSLNTVVLFLITAYMRYGSWLRKDSSFITYGTFGLLNMDWLSLLAALVSNIILIALIVEIAIWKIKKMPISIGVLQ